MGELDLEVRIGLHAGECEVLDGKVAGIAVSIGARVSALAAPPVPYRGRAHARARGRGHRGRGGREQD
jgi:class 3 adenylate cyclase